MASNLRAVSDVSKNAHVTIEGNLILLEGFALKDEALARELEKLSDEERVTWINDLLEITLRVKQTLSSTVQIQEIENAANRVTSELERAGDKAFDDLEEILRKQTDENNELALVNQLRSKFIQKLKEELDPLSTSSPFYSISQNLLKLIGVSAGEDASKEADQQGTKHGRDFNDTMRAIVQKVSSQTNDTSNYVNDIPGKGGKKVGDHIVDVDTNLTGGRKARVVWEYKAEKKVTQDAAYKEMKDALDCREAAAGVFVLAKTEHNESWNPFIILSNRCALIIVEEDNVDELLVRYAHLWSRIEAVRSLGVQEHKVDYEKVKSLLNDGKLLIDAFSPLVGAHSSIQKGLDLAASRTDDIKRKLSDLLRGIEGSLSVVETGNSEDKSK